MTVSSRRTIIGSIAASIAFVMELTLVPLLLPAIQMQFDLSIGELAWVFNSYGIAMALGVLLAGWMGDIFNANRVFGAGVLLFVLGSVSVAVAPSYEVLVMGRALQGFGGGVFSPLVPLLLTRASPHRPGKVLIVWGSVAGYVAAAAPLFYSGFLAGFGWNLAFIIFAAVALSAFAIVFMAEPSEEVGDKASNASYLNLFGNRELWVMFLYVFCTYGSISYFLFRLPLWLSENGFQVISIGFALSLLWLSFSFASTILRNQVDEPHVGKILLAAPLFIAAGFPLGFLFEGAIFLALASVLMGLGLACSNAPSTQVILKLAPPGTSAASASLDITFARLGGVATVTLLSQVASVYAISIILLLCSVALAAAFVGFKRVVEA